MQTSTNSEVANFPTNSTGKGNYSGTQGSTDKVIATGSSPVYEVNNVYDMAGNVCDWTIEANYIYYRVIRGGGCTNTASSHPALRRTYDDPSDRGNDLGCRATLYVKQPLQGHKTGKNYK